jgi:hypothetical protein
LAPSPIANEIFPVNLLTRFTTSYFYLGDTLQANTALALSAILKKVSLKLCIIMTNATPDTIKDIGSSGCSLR